MNLNNFKAGIDILTPYYDKPDGYHISAEHDEFFMHATDRPLSQEDLTKMIELGWHQDVDTGDDDFAVQHYDASESWSAYT
jgi:hypothetical protein